jgi:hypothetical protein
LSFFFNTYLRADFDFASSNIKSGSTQTKRKVFFFKRGDLNAGVDVRPKLQSFAMSCLLMSAVGLPLNVPSSYVRTGLLDESLELPCWGRSFGVADGPQQMLLMSNTICVILHHILQHLIHQHFAVLLHTITHTE